MFSWITIAFILYRVPVSYFHMTNKCWQRCGRVCKWLVFSSFHGKIPKNFTNLPPHSVLIAICGNEIKNYDMLFESENRTWMLFYGVFWLINYVTIVLHQCHISCVSFASNMETPNRNWNYEYKNLAGPS